MLKYNTTVSFLDLKTNGLRDEVCPCQSYFIYMPLGLRFIQSQWTIPLYYIQGAVCLARSLKVVNEALTSLDLGYNEIRVCIACFPFLPSQLDISSIVTLCFAFQDDGAFAIAQALKANEDVTITSLNLANNFLTKFGQVIFLLTFCFMILFCTVLVFYTWKLSCHAECSGRRKRPCTRDDRKGNRDFLLGRLLKSLE